MYGTNRNSFDFVLEDPGVPPPPPQHTSSEERAYRPRRPHTKSRHGCRECRRRRMKCGEERPTCLQCSEKNLTCQYREPSHSRRSSRTETTSNDSSKGSTPWTESSVISRQPSMYLAALSFPSGFFADHVYHRNDVPTVLEHFLQPTDPPWIGSHAFQHIMQTHGVQVASSTPYLMHTILAFSAAHLSHLDPQNRKWQFAAIAHYDYALSLWQERLTRIPSLVRDLPARMSAIFLHAMLAILHSTAELRKGPTLDQWKPGWTWVPSVLGMQGLLHGPGVDLGELDQEIWGPLLKWYLEPLDEVRGQAGLGRKSISSSSDLEVLAHLEQACRTTDPRRSTLYRRALDLWHPLIESKPLCDESETIDIFLSAASQLTLDFAILLKSRDARAILLVGFWLVMFGKQCQWWWIASSGRMKCRMAVQYLRSQPEVEEEGLKGVVEWMEEWVREGG